jgi:hypothetical protein
LGAQLPPFIIWCRQRTGSISLYKGLTAAVRDHPAAQLEPFDYDAEGPRQFASAAFHADPGHAAARVICAEGWLLKHVYEPSKRFGECDEQIPVGFHLALAQATSAHGYRHIHLYRRDRLARLVSKGLAEQLGTWFPGGWVDDIFADIKSGRRKIEPLDAERLIRWDREADDLWRHIGPQVSALHIAAEDVFGPHRLDHLQEIADFLGIASVHSIASHLGRGQDSQRVQDFVPNLDELRCAVEAY